MQQAKKSEDKNKPKKESSDPQASKGPSQLDQHHVS